MENINIYFVNYKNSVAGVGGVGTVSRDLVKLHPEIRFAFWDGSEATRNNDLGLIIQGLDHNKIHKQYFKKYLWAALHGIDFSVNDQELSIVRRQLIDEAGQVAVQLTDEANKINRQVNNVFWLNDYTSIAVIGKLRKLNKNSTLIFSFRTPFGVNGSYPKLHSGDMPIFKGLFEVNLITFHRQVDMQLFLNFIQEQFKEVALAINKVSNLEISLLHNDGFSQRLIVVPMGNNKDYRKQLLSTQAVRHISDKLLTQYKGLTIVSSISRFERTKGIEYEIQLIGKLLDKYPSLRKKFVFLRYTFRSMNKVDDYEYNNFHEQIVANINEINLRYGCDDWKPIVYRNDKKLNDSEITGILSASNILLIASLGDGFNHLSLEAIHCQHEGDQIQLILSDIGSSDYLEGHQTVTFDILKDVDTMRASILREADEVQHKYNYLNKSSSILTSKNWINTIISKAKQSVEVKMKESTL